jgi:HEAT repeat protein
MNWILIALGLSLQAWPSSGPAGDSPCTPQKAALAERYARVSRELAEAKPEGLNPVQAAHRQLVIELLGNYGASQAFPEWPAGMGVRWPIFRDDHGRLCALAHLLDRTGGAALVEQVAQGNNGGWLVELKNEPALLAWMKGHGLELSELARIQGPGWSEPPGDLASPPPMPAPQLPSSGSAPSDSGGPSGQPAGAATGSRSPGPVTGGGQGPAGPANAGPEAPSTGGGGAPEASDWATWWELNKLDWLVARPVPKEVEGDVTTTDPRSAYRARALVLADKGLASGDASVRAAAATLGGRLGIAADKLTARFKDSAPGVRHAALLGLGLSPGGEGLRLLTDVLRDQEAAERISPLARYYAALGLGLARVQGGPKDMDLVLGNYARQVELPQDLLGALGFSQLHPTESIRGQAIAWLGNPKLHQMVRCRAAESLRAFGDPATLRALQDALGDRQLEVRRSAALALGHVPEPLALQALETACDLEAEQSTRGLIYLSIGRRGGQEAGRYLREALEQESSGLRPHVVLALGIQAGLDSDADSCKRLREIQAKGRGADLTQAAALALGLARDPDGVKPLTALLKESGSEQERYFAALGLGLIGGPEATLVLRAALPKESSEMAKSALAQALALQGESADAGLLLNSLKESKAVEARVQYAAALGMHGTLAAIAGLLEMAESGDLPAPAHAGALEALGVLLEDGKRYCVGDLARSINPRAMPDWQGTLWNFLL